MKISALYVTAEYRGDHAADVKIALDVTEDTTIKELMHHPRVVNKYQNFDTTDIGKGTDHIEIRVVQEAAHADEG